MNRLISAVMMTAGGIFLSVFLSVWFGLFVVVSVVCTVAPFLDDLFDIHRTAMLCDLSDICCVLLYATMSTGIFLYVFWGCFRADFVSACDCLLSDDLDDLFDIRPKATRCD